MSPRDDRRFQPHVVAAHVLLEQRDRCRRPVGREHVRTRERRGERRNAEAATELEHAQRPHVAGDDLLGEGKPALPELGPVREELFALEGVLVEQGLRLTRS